MWPSVCPRLVDEPTHNQMSSTGAWVNEPIKALTHVPPQTFNLETFKLSKSIRIRGVAFKKEETEKQKTNQQNSHWKTNSNQKAQILSA